MSNPYLGEIRPVGFNFAPVGWAMCDGQPLPISQNTALFNILGTTYGGDGITTFALPDLRGTFGVHVGQGPGLSNIVLGQVGGTETVTLLAGQLAAHTHSVGAVAAAGNQNSPAGGVWAQPHYGRANDPQYVGPAAGVAMAPGAMTSTGGGGPHDNLPPYLVLNFIIALEGIFPSPN
jgi:microcystin-dependent protein